MVILVEAEEDVDAVETRIVGSCGSGVCLAGADEFVRFPV